MVLGIKEHKAAYSAAAFTEGRVIKFRRPLPKGRGLGTLVGARRGISRLPAHASSFNVILALAAVGRGLDLR